MAKDRVPKQFSTVGVEVSTKVLLQQGAAMMRMPLYKYVRIMVSFQRNREFIRKLACQVRLRYTTVEDGVTVVDELAAARYLLELLFLESPTEGEMMWGLEHIKTCFDTKETS